LPLDSKSAIGNPFSTVYDYDQFRLLMAMVYVQVFMVGLDY